MHPFALLLYSSPNLYSLIPSFVLSYRPHALQFIHSTKMARIPGKMNS